MSTMFDPSSATATVAPSTHDVTVPRHDSVPRASPPASATSARTTSIPWIDRLTLAAIGLVVIVVTLPVLRRFGLRENERDALRMLRVLAAEPASAAGIAGIRDVSTNRQPSLAELGAADHVLQKRLEDLETLDDGRLRRHGYLFDVVALAPGEPMLRAWPWEHAQTGRAAFVWTPRRGVLGHQNSDGRFSGPHGAPEAAEIVDGDWVAVQRR